ncbi:MBL fold metallo-hydrolase [Bradyrhizobium sp. PUT101]|uniref:MBL fold metallo-hydrolase n=1 Tax=Bradyrhizobium sp. PUT101 TaxID=3447427 RepID=UPI003F82A952
MALAKKSSSKSKGNNAKAPGKKSDNNLEVPEPGKKAHSSDGDAPSSERVKGLRVRMYRVGFGDFFLLSVPADGGRSEHILIDCGVHSQDLGSIRDAVEQMAEECGSRLALIIMTYRHADHISGFASCSDIFSKFTVDRVWMPWFEDPKNGAAMAFQASLTAMAGQLSMRLAARADDSSLMLKDMVDNITGGFAAAGGVSKNQKALDVLHGGFKNQADHNYYKAGDQPVLPKVLSDAGLSATILGPPIDPKLISQMTKKSQQYLMGETETDDEPVRPFARAFYTDKSGYPLDAFKIYDDQAIVRLVNDAQPDVLAARAKAADNTLNNQSLVVLFNFQGRHLLFAGDAQWGNWENFLYGGAYGTPGHTELTVQATSILNKIDFYKVGHHGSANATPKDAVAAMRMGCVGMCSTQIHAYNEVPREPLLEALRGRMNGQLARSDQVDTQEYKAEKTAGSLPKAFKRSTSGELFIDYEFK